MDESVISYSGVNIYQSEKNLVLGDVNVEIKQRGVYLPDR